MSVHDHNPSLPESTALNTILEPTAPETAETTATNDIATTPATAPVAEAQPTPAPVAVATEAEPEFEYDAEDFAKALESFDREQAAEKDAAQALTAEEAIVIGTVVKITDKHMVVDIGLKSEGLIPLDQVVDHTGAPKFNVGDSIEVVVEREEKEGGYLVSHEKALRHKVWDTLEEACNTKTPVKGIVVSRVKGGLTVDIGIKAFLPGSQVEIRPVRNLDGYIGTELDVRVIKLNKKRGNVVISRKEILEEEQNAKKSVTLSTLEEGAVFTGVVKSLTDYGAFVDMGGLDGLLHITDMSWGRLTHPRDLVNVGDEIQVKVLKFDKEKQRVSLGFKQLSPDPWLDATERYPVGAQVRGRVLSVTDYGAFVELEQGIEGLVHVSEMTWSKRMKHPSKLVKPGDEVDTIILAVNPTDRRISLGMKQLQENPWEELETKYPTGAVVEGRVRNLTDFGAFIEIAEGVEGLCHVSEAVDETGKQINLEVGLEHDFKIVKMNQEEKKVGLSIKAIGEEASRAEIESYRESSKPKAGKGGGSGSSSTSSNSGSTTLGDLLKWKQSEFEDNE